MRTQTDVHFFEVWETERNLHLKWLPLKITKELRETKTFVMWTKYINFCEFDPMQKLSKDYFYSCRQLIANWTFMPAILFEVLLFTYKYIVFWKPFSPESNIVHGWQTEIIELGFLTIMFIWMLCCSSTITRKSFCYKQEIFFYSKCHFHSFAST